ncbi:sensor histidine kinase [Streptomyces jumonjinensis]|uniref:histidine kinase n=1 Tax=Streptomyces jumonjinensis TaxID=1945 RepID=A0A646KCP7_STRJU|nr:sensor histidine kinase [Streptomyces jumonjinensis]MQT00003.1 sensor histidine kinase [Streptomyces jumonjinensis]
MHGAVGHGSGRAVAARGARYAGGLAVGSLTALAELTLALLPALALLLVLAWPRGRRAVLRPLGALADRATRIELRRLDRFLGVRIPPPYDTVSPPGGVLPYDRERVIRYAAARIPLGLLGGLITGCVLTGAGWVLFAVFGWFFVEINYPLAVVATGLLGVFGIVLGAQGVYGTALMEGWLARRFLGPSPQDLLERRIAQLAASRAEVMDAVNDERRRIERDLHDGVQQRLVALGMLLGRARRSRDPEHADRLLLQAHEESRRALTELREVAWRVYPTVLDEAGLRAALETVAERTPLPVGVEYEVPEPPARQVETVAYFVVSEAVTNVVKHSGATRITVSLRRAGGTLSLRVSDDGSGGADPSGGGLTGLASRVAALDGRFGVHSPPGGPTTITAELPCA